MKIKGMYAQKVTKKWWSNSNKLNKDAQSPTELSNIKGTGDFNKNSMLKKHIQSLHLYIEEYAQSFLIPIIDTSRMGIDNAIQ